jgi:FSR family fosmidomycin resistance protein-like MFS transporter
VTVPLIKRSSIISIPLLIQVVTYIPAGVISDRHPSLVFAGSYLTITVGAIVIALSNGFTGLVAGCSLLALGSTLYHPPGLKAASLGDSGRLNFRMGALNAGGSMGLALGPLILGLLVPGYGWRLSFLLWAPLVAAFSIPAYMYGRRISRQEETVKASSSLRSLITPMFLVVVAVGSLAELTFSNVGVFTTTYFNTVRGISPSLASIVFGVGPLAGIAGAILGGRLGDSVGVKRAALAVLVTSMALLFSIPLAPGLLLASTLYVLQRGLYSATLPIINSMIAKQSGVGARGLAFSVYNVVVNLGSAAAPPLTSILAESQGVAVVFPLSAVLLIPSVVLVARMGKDGSSA